MALIDFPDPEYASFEGIVAVGGQLSTENLLEAYRRGIFPWPMEGWPMLWFCPEPRAILEFKDLHIPRRLERLRKNSPFSFTIDRSFEKVITHCARVRRPGEVGTWITQQMLRAYCKLHQTGHAHSVEAWDEDNRLVGGLYGVDAGGSFAGESMFFLQPNASKLALLHLIDYLRARGLDWMDIQMLTPHMAALGAKEISRTEFLSMLATQHRRGLKLFE
ncbi:MAG: leucyl/phenylalanyl-tRNA--protein transferase [Acidobacteria bacterium]|nr:leucyl/phenylalanyl-tRNA--protein transferase [Acidobacteriota bacterium]